MRTVVIFVVMLLAASQAFGATCAVNINPWGDYSGEVNLAWDLTGCLQATTGLTVSSNPGPWDTAYIAWNITPTVDGYLYEYTWNAASKDLSHLILGVSDNCGDSTCIWNFSGASMDFGWWGPQGESNPGLPSQLWGIKVTPSSAATSLTFSFESNRVPVWQNFYAKDGNDGPVYAFNAGFGSNAGGYFVAAPDSVVPEPGFYGLLSLGLAGLYLAARRRIAQ
jgi:hypothetical protein